MTNAYVMVVTATGTSPDVLPQVLDLEHVSEAHIVAGDYDLVVELDADTPSQILPVVTRDLQRIDGVGHTRTYVVLD